jgi:hypothetical protein
MAGKGDEPRGGDLLGRPLGVVVHLVRVAGPSTWADRHAASSAAGSFFSSVQVRSCSGKR